MIPIHVIHQGIFCHQVFVNAVEHDEINSGLGFVAEVKTSVGGINLGYCRRHTLFYETIEDFQKGAVHKDMLRMAQKSAVIRYQRLVREFNGVS